LDSSCPSRTYRLAGQRDEYIFKDNMGNMAKRKEKSRRCVGAQQGFYSILENTELL
jgi:hypothetical protein